MAWIGWALWPQLNLNMFVSALSQKVLSLQPTHNPDSFNLFYPLINSPSIQHSDWTIKLVFTLVMSVNHMFWITGSELDTATCNTLTCDRKQYVFPVFQRYRKSMTFLWQMTHCTNWHDGLNTHKEATPPQKEAVKNAFQTKCCLWLIILGLCSLFNMVISNPFSWPVRSYCTYHWAKPEIQVSDDLHRVGRCLCSESTVLLLHIVIQISNTDAFSESADVWNNDSYGPKLHKTQLIFLVAALRHVLCYVFSHKQVSAPPISHKPVVAQ